MIVGEDPDFKCPGYGAWPHPERCELYYTCYLGEPTYVWQCRKDYLFDTNYYGCNFPELTDCGDRLRPGGESTITQRTTTTPVTPTPDPSFTCPADNGFFPAQPGVCQSNFYICVEGVAYAQVTEAVIVKLVHDNVLSYLFQTCPGNAVFDPVYLVCLPPSSANCGKSISFIYHEVHQLKYVYFRYYNSKYNAFNDNCFNNYHRRAFYLPQ